MSKKTPSTAKEELLLEPPICKDLVITRNPESNVHVTGGIDLAEWKSVVAADPSMKKMPYYVGADPRTRTWQDYPLTGGAKWKRKSFSFSNGRILAMDCEPPAQAKTHELAEKLGARCVPLGEGPVVNYRPGECRLRLGSEWIELGFPIDSAIWWQIHGLLLVLEQPRRDILYLFNRDGTRHCVLAPPADFAFYYLTSYGEWGISVVCVVVGNPFPMGEDWNFVIDLERNRLNPMAPTR